MESEKNEAEEPSYLVQQLIHLAFCSVLSVSTFIVLQHFSMTAEYDLPLLKYRNLGADITCFVVVMVLSDFAAGTDLHEKEKYFGAGLTAAILFLVLTTLPQFAQEYLDSWDIKTQSRFITCVLIIYEDDPLKLGKTEYRSLFACIF